MSNAHGGPQADKLRRGFTLMEIVLAIALTSVVMYLLTTAIELYMVRVDSSRSRVESAQLARTLLDQMAADISATRLYAPQSPGTGGGQFSGGGGGGATGGQGGGAPSDGANNGGSFGGGGGGMTSGAGGSGGVGSAGGSGGSGSSTLPSTDVQGIFGTIDQLRIDRAAFPNWARAARQVLPEEPATVADLPASVRYYLADGDRQTAQELALKGVSEEETAEVYAGLYREAYVTAAIKDEADPLVSPTQREGGKLELLAPEVVKMEINYFDGTQFVEAWDSLEEGALPAGIEIRLTIYEPSFAESLEEPDPLRDTGQPTYRSNELVEYRRFVRLPSISPPQAAEALLPVAGNNGNAGGGPGESAGQGGGGGATTGGGSGNGGRGGNRGGGDDD